MDGGCGFEFPLRGECRSRFLSKTAAGEVKRAAFMLVDVDDFSRFNILYSHSFGDRLLERAARDVRALLPKGLETYRYGADQLLIAGFGYTESDMLEAYRDLARRARANHVLDGIGYRFTVSAAVVSYPDNGSSWDDIEKGLSVALKKAKSDGGNRVVVFTSALLGDRLQEQGLAEQVSDDIAAGFRGFSVAHQPICGSAALEVCGAETLLRYSMPSGTAVGPAELVPLLESSGLIKPVGLWVLEQAVVDCGKWLELIPGFRVDVNISVVQLRDAAFADDARELLAKHGLDPAHIVLELTESLYMDDDEKVAANIETLRGLGFGFAVDDFGKGYSSLSRLMTFDCDLVKIDRTFVQMLNENAANYEFVRSVVELCHRYGKKVCAEGVEKVEELQAVNAIGADMVQGFYISRPVSKEAFERAFVAGDFDGDVLQFTPDAAFKRKQLAYNRDFLMSIVEAMPVSMHLMNSKNEVVMWNEATTRLFGYAPDVELLSVFDGLSPEVQPDGEPSGEKARKLVARAMEQGSLTFEWQYLDTDGNPLPVEVTIVRLEVIDEYGKNMLACFLRDLRPQLAVEERDRQFNRKLRAIIDATPLCLNLWNHRFENVMCNKEAVELFGLQSEREYLEGFDRLSPEFQPDGQRSVDKARAKIEEAFATGRCHFSWLHRTLEGEDIPAEITLAKIDIQDDDGFDMVVGFTRDLRVFDGPRRSSGEGAGAMLRDLTDVSDNKRLIDELRIDAVFWDIVSDLSDELLFRLMVRTSTIEYLGRMRDMFDIDHYMEDFPESIVARGNIYAEDVPAFRELARNMKAGVVKPMDMRFVLKDGRRHWFRVVYDCMYDEHGIPIMAAGKAIDIQAEKDLEQKARIDLLTRCLNKVSFEDEVRAALDAACPDELQAFLIVDIDDFKTVNDTLGHHFGDLVLVDVASCLRACFGGNDLIGRIGGDEFVVFVRDAVSRDAVEARALAAMDATRGLYADDNGGYRVSVSVGVAYAPDHGTTYEALYQASDEALYRAKTEGKNRCSIFDKKVSSGAKGRRTLPEDDAHRTSEYYDPELVATVFNLLYETSDIGISVSAVMKHLGLRLGADRCYVYEADDRDGSVYRRTHEWCAEGIRPAAPCSFTVPGERFGRLFEHASADGIVGGGSARAFDELGVREVLGEAATGSFLHAQVKSEGVVATILGFDVLEPNRVWSEREINSILYAAKMISTFLLGERRAHEIIRTSQELQESFTTLESILEDSDMFTYVVDVETFDILYANKSLRDISPLAREGEKCYRAIRYHDAPCVDCPAFSMGDRDSLPPYKVTDNGITLVTSVKRVAWKNDRAALMVNCMNMSEGDVAFPPER